MALGMGFIFNILKRSWLYSFFQRVIFYNSPLPPKFCLDNGYRGEAIRLNAANFKSALMASASIPLVVSGIRDIYGAPKGIYRDGGIVDYHLNQKYAKGKEEVTLLFNHQKRVVPVWFEKRLGFKHTPAENLKNVLMVYPSEEFVGRLPGGKIPDREDFKIFLNDQDTRIGNWRKATKASAHFGELFLELVESGKIRHAIKRI
jgi:hypothetical protein